MLPLTTLLSKGLLLNSQSEGHGNPNSTSSQVPYYHLDYTLRSDGIPVALLNPGILEAQIHAETTINDNNTNIKFNNIPFHPFSSSFVQEALSQKSVDYRQPFRGQKPMVTAAADQGPHPFCGTFARIAVLEGQYGRFNSNHTNSDSDSDQPMAMNLYKFSEEYLIDCAGWNLPQLPYVQTHGLFQAIDYPYDLKPWKNDTQEPPIASHPCKYTNLSQQGKVVKHTKNYTTQQYYTGTTGGAPDEDQLAAFIYQNGPVGIGIEAEIFGKRMKGCDGNDNDNTLMNLSDSECFITPEMCREFEIEQRQNKYNEDSISTDSDNESDNQVKQHSINHAITIVGYGIKDVPVQAVPVSDSNESDINDPDIPLNNITIPIPYWLIKNSWGEKFANKGFIKVARGVNCAGLGIKGNGGWVFTYGDWKKYYEDGGTNHNINNSNASVNSYEISQPVHEFQSLNSRIVEVLDSGSDSEFMSTDRMIKDSDLVVESESQDLQPDLTEGSTKDSSINFLAGYSGSVV